MNTKFNKLEWQRLYRKRTGNACTNKYEKTPKGFLMRKYRNMINRVSGIQKTKYHLYKNLPILSKDDFYIWANGCKELWDLFKIWSESGYDMKLCPSIDRIDPEKGYIISNMRWVTHSENSRNVTR